MSCNLPEECNCELCKLWENNSWDVSLTPDWQTTRKKDDEDD